jgi:hypothetical protein
MTVKEYAKYERISEQGVRKRVASKLVKSVQLDDNQYIVVNNFYIQNIKDLKQKISLLTSQNKTLKAEKVSIIKQDEEIEYLRDRVKSLEGSLEASTAKKEELYEKVINTLALPSNIK